MVVGFQVAPPAVQAAAWPTPLPCPRTLPECLLRRHPRCCFCGPARSNRLRSVPAHSANMRTQEAAPLAQPHPMRTCILGLLAQPHLDLFPKWSIFFQIFQIPHLHTGAPCPSCPPLPAWHPPRPRHHPPQPRSAWPAAPSPANTGEAKPPTNVSLNRCVHRVLSRVKPYTSRPGETPTVKSFLVKHAKHISSQQSAHPPITTTHANIG
jgi:hypothetical protein